MKILVVGDIHGDIAAIELAFKLACLQSVDRILQVGDFGYFPRIPAFRRFLRVCSRLAQETGIPVVFIDGNHEDHYMLPHRADVLSFHELLPSLFWAARGFHFIFEKLHFVFLGGAYSIDAISRVLGATVFPGLECIGYKDIMHTLCAPRCDVLVCHDAPTSIDFNLKHLYSAGEANRATLDNVAAAIQPRLILHGHYHMYHDTLVGTTRVVGLGCELNVLDLFGLLSLAGSDFIFSKLAISDNSELVDSYLARKLSVAYSIPEDLAGLDVPL